MGSRQGSRLLNSLAIVSTVILVAFHLLLFWQRVIDQSLLQPIPALRWLATLLLLGGLYRLHSRGLSLIKGRSALVFWLVVLLLHASFSGPLAEPGSAPESATDHGLLLGLPALGVLAGIGLSTIWRILFRRRRRIGNCKLPCVALTPALPGSARLSGIVPTLDCRPPPAI